MDQAKSDRLAWIEHWKHVGPMLDKQSQQELRNLTMEERQEQIKNLLELAWQFRHPRTDRGLVELQRRLSRIFAE